LRYSKADTAPAVPAGHNAFVRALLASNPKFLWKLDDVSGVADATGNGLEGVLTDVTLRAAGINAMVPVSASFNGASSLISGEDGCSVRGLSKYTFVAAVKLPAVVAEGQFWFESCSDSASYARLSIYVSAVGNLIVAARSGIHTQTLFTKTSSDTFMVADLDTLLHVVVDIANDSILLYKDGVLVASGGTQGFGADTIVEDVAPAAVPQIGKYTAGSPRWLSGSMACVGIFPDALPAETILTQAQAGGFAEIVEVPSYDVTDYGTVGTDDEANDDTAAIQAAIDDAFADGMATVKIPDGTYWINPDIGVKPKSGVYLWLTSANAKLKAKRTASAEYEVVHFEDVINSGISGGTIIGDRDIHTGTTGEQGYGVRVNSSTNILIYGVTLTDCWGDGIAIGGMKTGMKYSQNVIIQNCICDGNRRQGLTIASVKGCTVKNSTFKNTAGTNPQAGIDIEPWLPSHYIQDVLIENCAFDDNAGWGFDWWFYHLVGSTTAGNVTIAVNNCTYSGNGDGGMRYAAGFTAANSYYDYLDIVVDGVQIGSGGMAA